MAISLVQTVMGTAASGAGSILGTFSSNTTTGNIIAISFLQQTGTVTGVTDGLNTYGSVMGTLALGNRNGHLLYATNITGGSTIFTIQHSSTGASGFVAREYTGLSSSPFDVSSSGTVTSANTGNAGTTNNISQGSELVILSSFWDSTARGINSVTGYGNQGTIITTGMVIGMWDKLTSSLSQQTGTISFTGLLDCLSIIATFKDPIPSLTFNPGYTPQGMGGY